MPGFSSERDQGDVRHDEARTLVERARRGELVSCTTASILSEVYGALTWEKAEPRHDPLEAASAVRSTGRIAVCYRSLERRSDCHPRALELAAMHRLTARRVHDARHAAAALSAGVAFVYTYDAGDWKVFETDGLSIVGPATTIARLSSLSADR